jgi:two-component system, NtrC family, sensor kinase
MSSTLDVSAEKNGKLDLQARPTLLNGMSLRAKGVWVMILFLIYTVSAGLIMSKERNALYADLQQLEAVHEDEQRQFGLNILVARSILVVNDSYSSVQSAQKNDLKESIRKVAIQVDLTLTSMTKLAQSYPELTESVVALRANLDDLVSRPASQATLTGVRNNFHKLVLNLGQVSDSMREHKQVLIDRYRKTFDSLSLIWSFTAAVGVVFLGSLVMIFVTRLAWDIKRVQDRALAVVEGYRGPSLVITRHDELGALMEAVNKMQLEFRQNELQMELIRQQRFHKEKMVAVGSLAAVVAHEINNPLSAIVGIAQSMVDMRGVNEATYIEQSAIILEQAKRVIAITGQISEFSRPQSMDSELLDLNNLIRNTVKFISFDRRFGRVDMELNLDSNIPAVCAVGDHLTQVIMNLLINAVDAGEGRVSPKLRIIVSSNQHGGEIVVSVADNGVGMSAATQGRVFEEFFTTKPVGKGSGIGLAVSKSLIESAGGHIEIESQLGTGTTVSIHLPVQLH